MGHIAFKFHCVYYVQYMMDYRDTCLNDQIRRVIFSHRRSGNRGQKLLRGGRVTQCISLLLLSKKYQSVTLRKVSRKDLFSIITMQIKKSPSSAGVVRFRANRQLVGFKVMLPFRYNGDTIAIFYTEKLVFKIMLRGFFTSEVSKKKHNMTLKSPISRVEW